MAGLEALQQIKADLAAQAEREKAEKLATLLAARRLEAQRNMFANAVGKVQPLPATARVDLKQVAPAAAVLQHELDAQAALAESLSDEMDITSLLDTDAQLSFRRPGVGVDVVQKLRQGKWSIQRQVDLHGQRSDEARETLSRFIRDNPTIVMLALGFLIMIGMTLIAEGFGAHVPKGYVYTAMAFSAGVEGLNILSRRSSKNRKV